MLRGLTGPVRQFLSFVLQFCGYEVLGYDWERLMFEDQSLIPSPIDFHFDDVTFLIKAS